jgi:uncharacterized membrane protein
MKPKDPFLGSGLNSSVGMVASLGAVIAGAAIIEAALIPGLLIGGAAVLAPRLLSRDRLIGLGDKLRRLVPDPVPDPAPASALPGHDAEASASAEPATFNTWRAVVKTITYRVLVTSADFGANYFVIGELATAAGLSSVSLVAGPIFYFAHEAAWHFYGPASARRPNPLEAAVHVPIPVTEQDAEPQPTRIVGIRISRALAKTVTYEGVTGVSEFSVNFLFVRDLATAAGLTGFSLVISPIVYYLHEKAWDYYDASKVRTPGGPELKLLPTAA